MQRIKTSKDHTSGFLEVTFITKHTVISLYSKKLITCKIFTTYDIKLCKTLLKVNHYFSNA